MIKELDFKKIDAFVYGNSTGNPAGCVTLAEDLSDDKMLKIAYELKGFVSEVGFIKKQGDEFRLKYYSSEREVEFCGHATIALMYDLIKNDKELIKKDEVFINVNAGRLSVFNKIAEEDAVYIMAPEPKYLPCTVEKDEIAKVFKIDADNISADLPIQIVDGGLRTLIVPIKTMECCININPDLDELKTFCQNSGVDIIHIFTKETYTKLADYRTRVFAPTFGYLEDPATGSGNAAFGYYLIKNNMWNGDITVEQSSDLKNPNFVKLKKYDSENVRILFGGSGAVRIEGKYFLNC